MLEGGGELQPPACYNYNTLQQNKNMKPPRLPVIKKDFDTNHLKC